MHEQMTRLVDQALSSGTPIGVLLTNTRSAVNGQCRRRGWQPFGIVFQAASLLFYLYLHS